VSAIFRIVERDAPTLLIDEADTFLKENDELRGILNTGHRRGGQVTRTVGDDHEPRLFSTWAPVAIAMIGQLPATLDDRSIVLATVRSWRDPAERRAKRDCRWRPASQGSAKSNARRSDCCQNAYSHFRHFYSPFDFYVLYYPFDFYVVGRCQHITLMFASHGIDADQSTAVCEAHRARRRGDRIESNRDAICCGA
jgi:hypothetical protein